MAGVHGIRRFLGGTVSSNSGWLTDSTDWLGRPYENRTDFAVTADQGLGSLRCLHARIIGARRNPAQRRNERTTVHELGRMCACKVEWTR